MGGPITGTARWSPDGRRIVFDSRPGNNSDIYVIQAEGGAPRRLTDQPGEDARPAWSADGKSIYFCSDRSGRQEIWRMTAEGGSAAQITKTGGISVIPADDGEWLYYCVRQPERIIGPIRKIRTDGSNDSEAIPLPVQMLKYTVKPTGVYFVVNGRENSTLHLLRFATGKIVKLMKLDYLPLIGLSVSPDERYVLVTKPDQNGTDLMLVENFR
jgi:dipeptidyl aminopeptidase/acylaminoacyl peptidase